MSDNGKIWVGFIAYGDSTLKYLPFFLDSLAEQAGVELKIVAIDNTENDEHVVRMAHAIESLREEVQHIRELANLVVTTLP